MLSTFIKLTFSITTFALSIFEWPIKTGFTVFSIRVENSLYPAQMALTEVR